MIRDLTEILQTPLPSLEYQKKRLFTPTETQVLDVHALLNEAVFNNELPTPPVRLRQSRHYGVCKGFDATHRKPHHAEIQLHRRFHCIQWMVFILAHEMVHQYQWDVDGILRLEQGKNPLLSHGPSFYKFRPKLAEVGIPLKAAYDSPLWLKTQLKL